MSSPTTGQLSNGPLTADKDRESFCDDCGARITVTRSVGEAGHAPTCPRRKEAYTGHAGRKEAPSGASREGSA